MTAPEPELRAGDRVTLTDVPDGYEVFAIKAPLSGVVDLIDSLGTAHVRWDQGQRFGIIAGARHLLRRDGDDPAS